MISFLYGVLMSSVIGDCHVQPCTQTTSPFVTTVFLLEFCWCKQPCAGTAKVSLRKPMDMETEVLLLSIFTTLLLFYIQRSHEFKNECKCSPKLVSGYPQSQTPTLTLARCTQERWKGKLLGGDRYVITSFGRLPSAQAPALRPSSTCIS